MPLPVVAVAAGVSALAGVSIAVRQWLNPLPRPPLPTVYPVSTAPPVTTTAPPINQAEGPPSTINWGSIAESIAAVGGNLQRTAEMMRLERMRREATTYTAAVAAEAGRMEEQRTLFLLGAVAVLVAGGVSLAMRR